MELQERSPTYTSGPGSSTDADRFDIRIKLSVRDAALLWRMAAAHALAQPGLEQEDVEDIIGPMDDPSVADCLGLLLAPRAIAGCCCTDFSVEAGPLVQRPRKVRAGRLKTIRSLPDGQGASPLLAGMLRPVPR